MVVVVVVMMMMMIMMMILMVRKVKYVINNIFCFALYKDWWCPSWAKKCSLLFNKPVCIAINWIIQNHIIGSQIFQSWTPWINKASLHQDYDVLGCDSLCLVGSCQHIRRSFCLHILHKGCRLWHQIREGCSAETLNMSTESKLVHLSDRHHSTGNRRIYEQHITTFPLVYSVVYYRITLIWSVTLSLGFPFCIKTINYIDTNLFGLFLLLLLSKTYSFCY